LPLQAGVPAPITGVATLLRFPMDRLSLIDTLLRAGERLLPTALCCCDLVIWMLLVPGKLLSAF
jgi:hypothetical protein